jgi:serum/glucocorticoid-regulated kinase 2
LPPFYDENTNEMYKKIVQEPLTFPSHEIVPAAARDLLTRLLDRDPQRRLGANGAAEIKAHHFFSNIDWRKLLQRKYEPTFKPNVVCSIHLFPLCCWTRLNILQIDARDTNNFDDEFTREAPRDSVDDTILSQTAQEHFVGWSYNRPVAGLGDAGGSVRDPSFGSIPE